MKVEPTGRIRTSPVKRAAKAGKTGKGGFTKHLDSSVAALGAVTGSGPVQPVDALIAVQEVEDATSQDANRRARRWGEDMLDNLERVRLDLLNGALSHEKLKGLAVLVSERKETATDPQLVELLAEIELRARVELAKYEARS